jgi:hypothetical protein
MTVNIYKNIFYKLKHCGSCNMGYDGKSCGSCIGQSNWRPSKEAKVEILKLKIERCLNL